MCLMFAGSGGHGHCFTIVDGRPSPRRILTISADRTAAPMGGVSIGLPPQPRRALCTSQGYLSILRLCSSWMVSLEKTTAAAMMTAAETEQQRSVHSPGAVSNLRPHRRHIFSQ